MIQSNQLMIPNSIVLGVNGDMHDFPVEKKHPNEVCLIWCAHVMRQDSFYRNFISFVFVRNMN